MTLRRSLRFTLAIAGISAVSNCLNLSAAPPTPAEAEAAFKQLDVTGNGFLTGKELETINVAAVDANGDQVVSLAEYLAVALTTGKTNVPGKTTDAEPRTKFDPSRRLTASGKLVQPLPGKMVGKKPVGLFYMQKYWIATRSLEKSCWYFTEDGRFYADLRTGFSEEDLKAHDGPHGTYRVDGKTMTIAWSSGNKATSEMEIEDSGFMWDTGNYLAVKPFNGKSIAGKYSGGSSITFNGSTNMSARTLQLHQDGTFATEGAVSFRTDQETKIDRTESDYSVGASASNNGRWKLDGYYLILDKKSGESTRHIVFPLDDESTPLNPDRLFFDGMMLKNEG